MKRREFIKKAVGGAAVVSAAPLLPLPVEGPKKLAVYWTQTKRRSYKSEAYQRAFAESVWLGKRIPKEWRDAAPLVNPYL